MAALRTSLTFAAVQRWRLWRNQHLQGGNPWVAKTVVLAGDINVLVLAKRGLEPGSFTGE